MANIYDMSDTWNAGATTFTAIKMNVTDTDSASGSLLMDLQVGGSSKFSVSKGGATKSIFFEYINGGTYLTPVIRMAAEATTGFSYVSTTNTGYIAGGIAVVAFGRSGPTPRVVMKNNAQLEWSSADINGAGDLILYRDAAGTLAQRNSTNAQTFNLYNTYTDASNYERGFMKWNSNVLEIGAEAAGTGTARAVRIVGPASNDLSVFGSSSASLTLRSGTLPGTVRTSMFAGFGAGVVATETAHPLLLRSQGVERLRLDTVGSVQIVTALTVATLPGTPLVGMMARVTDGDSGLTHGQTVVNSGAGATPYLVWYNGTNWTVIGV